jgi:tRNA modification GTPase
MSYHPDDTICAISSAAGGAVRGLVRMSGTGAAAIASKLFRADDGSPVQGARTAIATTGKLRIALRDNRASSSPSLRYDGEIEAPCELFVWPTDRSYTREPVVEFHTVGSAPILQAVLAALCRAGGRLAEPGEFTLRAFLAGRLDLTQVEAVLGVIDAPDRDTLCAALSQLAGGLARPLDRARSDLTQLLAELEAGLDFVEEDIRFISESETVDRIKSLSGVLDEVDRQLESRNTDRELPQVALIGPPNVGKSSLFNALSTRFGHRTGPAADFFVPALVSPRSGTTRDYLSAEIAIGDASYELLDTAGFEANTPADAQTIEGSAQSLTAERRGRANVRAYCMEASQWSEHAGTNWRDFVPADCDILVLTKADLVAPQVAIAARLQSSKCGFPAIITSSITDGGLEDLGNAIQCALTRDASERRGPAITTTATRCRESVRQAAAAVRLATDAAENSAGDELVAGELRVALAELGKVVGAVYTDDLLDRIFRTFCIGK